MAKHRKCPKCKSRELQLTECWKNHAIGFDYNDGKFSQGWLCEGVPYKVQAKCMNCGHEWTLKGVSQVSDLDGY